METKKELVQNIPNILIVDDISDNLTLLSELLKDEGYKVRPVLNGALALHVAEKELPDLIILDIMMPDMDGIEVCRRLKENSKLKDIPVIFISALNDTRDVVKALNSGGVDYITKPFLDKEIIARVATHLKVSQQKKEIQKQNIEMQKLKEIISELKATKK